jgi:hypothetical protein
LSKEQWKVLKSVISKVDAGLEWACLWLNLISVRSIKPDYKNVTLASVAEFF